MSDQFNINIDIKTNDTKFLRLGFELLQEYIINENNTDNILPAIEQIHPLLKKLISHPHEDLSFMDNETFKNFQIKIKFLRAYPDCAKLINLIEGDSKNLDTLKSELDTYFIKQHDSDKLYLANAYLDFYTTLKTSLDNQDYNKIKESWNKNSDFFESDRITHAVFASKFPDYKFPKDLYQTYFKFIKIAQEKIVELLWTNFLHKPETVETLSKFCPDFFQFIDWLDRTEKTTNEFIGLLEQKHFDCLSYASKTEGFDYFIENLFLLKKTPLPQLAEFNPFSDDDTHNYHYINLDTIQKLNANNINADVILKQNSFGVPTHLRDYLYHHIQLFETASIKYSPDEFQALDKLLIVYEKQKMESVFLPRNNKSKTNKI